jgi:hypothetical protein
VTGLFVSQIRTFGKITGSAALDAFVVWFSYLLPNFQNFNVIAAAAHGRRVPATLIVQNTAYAAIYAAMVLLGAALIFSRRNLK